MLLSNQWFIERIKRKIKKYLETNENGSTACQNLKDVAKAVLRGKVIVINTYVKKKEKSQTIYLYTSRNLKENKLVSPKSVEGNNKDQRRNK